MNANELADELAFKHIAGDDSGAFSSKIIIMLRQLGLAESIIKQQQLEIERAKYGARPNNAYQAPEVKKENKIEKKVQEWIATKSDNEEVYNNLTAIYYNSSDLQKFAELLNDYNTDLYNECKQYVG
jgi:crotonobetainyl-CoA:carnitine CoA-transferase CaiB-like acyl-CoA transferase